MVRYGLWQIDPLTVRFLGKQEVKTGRRQPMKAIPRGRVLIEEVRCPVCGVEVTGEDFLLICPHCGEMIEVEEERRR